MILRLAVAVWMLSPVAFGWGEAGHRIVARVAAARIQDPAVRARILAILDLDSDTKCRQEDFAERLACVSTWADDIKRTTMRSTSNWHFVDIPRNETSYDPQRDCKDSPRGDCLINAVLRENTLLAHPPEGTTDQAKAEAVKFLVHLIGDLTQPLHCADDRDAGGNRKTATWFGQSDNQWGHWNLHSVWDDGMIERSPIALAGGGAVDVTYAKVLLDGEATPATAKDPLRHLVAWAVEGHDVAVKQTYGTLPEARQGKMDGSEHTDRMYYALGAEYEEKNLPVLEKQLRRGGERLAGVLIQLFAQPQ